MLDTIPESNSESHEETAHKIEDSVDDGMRCFIFQFLVNRQSDHLSSPNVHVVVPEDATLSRNDTARCGTASADRKEGDVHVMATMAASVSKATGFLAKQDAQSIPITVDHEVVMKDGIVVNGHDDHDSLSTEDSVASEDEDASVPRALAPMASSEWVLIQKEEEEKKEEEIETSKCNVQEHISSTTTWSWNDWSLTILLLACWLLGTRLTRLSATRISSEPWLGPLPTAHRPRVPSMVVSNQHSWFNQACPRIPLEIEQPTTTMTTKTKTKTTATTSMTIMDIPLVINEPDHSVMSFPDKNDQSSSSAPTLNMRAAGISPLAVYG